MRLTRLLTKLALLGLSFNSALPLSAAEVSEVLLKQIREQQAETAARLAVLEKQNSELKKKIATLEAAASPASEEKAPEVPKVGPSAAARGEGARREVDGLVKARKEPEVSKLFATPDSPAAAVLGIAPERIIHARTPKQLILETINGLDQRGNFQTGFAIDFAPLQLLPGVLDRHPVVELPAHANAPRTFSWDNYAIAVARRTQLSFAAIRGTESEDKSGKLALGLNVTFMDADDPLVSGRFRPRTWLGRKVAYEGYSDALNYEFERDTPFRDEGIGKLMNILHRHASWSAGAAATWVSPDPEAEDYEYSGLTAWSTFSIGFATRRGSGAAATSKEGASEDDAGAEGLNPKAPFRLLLHGRYDDQQSIAAADAINPPQAGVDPATGAPLPAPAFVDQDSLLLVGGLRFGRKDFNATASVSYAKRWQRSGGSGSEDSLLYAISAEKRIGESPMWITLSAGQEVGGTNDGNTILLGGVRLGFGRGSFAPEEKGEL